MKIEAVCIQNFLAISDARVELNDKGLVLIQGENLDDSSADSNGTGKSSIVDALCWGLYGVTARGVSGDAVVNRTEGKDCSVCVYLNDNGKSYIVHRTRKHSTLKNQTKVTVKTAEAITDISKGTEKETQKVINRVMGCSLDVFKAAVYSGQESMIDLPSLTDKNLKMIVEEAAGIERIEKAYEVARKEAEEVFSAYSDATMKRDLYWDDIASSESFVQAAKNDMDEWGARQSVKIRGLTADVESAQRALNGSVSDLNSLDEESIMQRKKSIVDVAREAKNKRNERQQSLTKVEHDIAVQGSNRGLYIDKVKHSVDVIKKCQNNPETFVCETCGSPLNAEKIQNLISNEMENIKGYKKSIEMVDGKLNALKKEKEELTTLFEGSDEEDTGVINSLLEEIQKLNEVKERVARAETNLRSAELFKSQAESEVNPYIKTYNDALSNKEDSVKLHQSYEKKAEELEAEYNLRKATVDVFSPSGVRALILDTVTPFLNQRTAEYLSVLSDGNLSATWTTLSKTAKGELREKFKIEVSNDKGGETFNALSGGEKRKVRIATALALQDLVSSRATKPIELWVGDEIDNALDASGLERLMTILNTKAKERGTVLIISHTNLRDWCSNVITVRKENGQSTIDWGV